MNEEGKNEAALTKVAEEFGGSAGKVILSEAFGKHVLEIRFILENLRNGADSSILDIGGGLGTVLITLRKLLGDKPRLSLMDKFEEYTDDNVMGSKERGFKMMDKYHISYSSKDVWQEQKLPFSDGSFDVVTLFDMIEHLPGSPLNLLRDIRRMLKKNGKIIVSVPNSISLIKRLKLLFGKHPYIPFELWISDKYYSHYREYSRMESAELLKKAGFKEIKTMAVSEPTKTRILKRSFNGKKIGYFSPTFWLLVLFYILESVNPKLRPAIYCVASA
jgi:2-polyprenyl-3-methyl-5-hydroxy-6-metoxy-1,4-benzoquinol methylase